MSVKLTQEQIDEVHYLPANNVFAFHMTGGIAGARVDSAQEYERILKEDAVGKEFADWYKASCDWLIERLENGGTVSTDYPRLILEGEA